MRFPRRLDFSIEEWAEDPSETPLGKWGGGIAMPAIIALYAASVLMTGSGTLFGRRGRLVLTGTDASTYGVLLLGLALFFHAHFFWSATERLGPWSPTGKIAGLLLFIGGIAWLAVRFVVFA